MGAVCICDDDAPREAARVSTRDRAVRFRGRDAEGRQSKPFARGAGGAHMEEWKWLMWNSKAARRGRRARFLCGVRAGICQQDRNHAS